MRGKRRVLHLQNPFQTNARTSIEGADKNKHSEKKKKNLKNSSAQNSKEGACHNDNHGPRDEDKINNNGIKSNEKQSE